MAEPRDHGDLRSDDPTPASRGDAAAPGERVCAGEAAAGPAGPDPRRAELAPAPGRALVKVYGRLGHASAYAIRDFLHRCDVPFEWVPLGSDSDAREQADVGHVHDDRLPVCVFPDGARMEAPTIRELIERLGWFRTPSRAEYDLAIYGAGPAGLSAALYAGADGLSTVLIERWALGGQAGSSSKIENYLGFPKGISGTELAERARLQAEKFGVEILLARESVSAQLQPGRGVGVLEDGTRIVARASICATGVAYRRLGVPDETRWLGAGVYYGAGASEAPLLAGAHVFIVGGGNSAGQAAMHFAPHAQRVTLVVRGDSLKSSLSHYLLERIAATRNIEVITQTEVTALRGDKTLREVTLRNTATGAERRVPTRWLFVCIGGDPQTQWAGALGMARDEAGYLVTGRDLSRGGVPPPRWPLDREPYFLETNIPGVFAAGDVRHGAVRRCASAVGEGAMAVAFVHRVLDGG